jgi:ABC-type nitrate/sulfonate/bicarbonate transport system ATPase subunit
MTLAQAPTLQFEHVSHSFAKLEVLSDICLEVPSGSLVSILGPSGSGKSTLLDIAAGLLQPLQGRVLLDQHVVEGAGHAGYMPQKDSLLPWRTVIENALLGTQLRGLYQQTAKALVKERLGRFGLAGFEQSYPHELSGGMRQRVALLRTIMYEDKLLLLDEPLSALDALTRLQMQRWLGATLDALDSTVLLVTHDIREALLLSDKVVVLSARPAQIVLELEVPLAHPRSHEVLRSAEMLALEAQLFDVLVGVV